MTRILAAIQVWFAIITAKGILASEATLEDKLKGVHTLSQAASVSSNLVKLADLESRIAALERAVQGREGRNGHDA